MVTTYSDAEIRRNLIGRIRFIRPHVIITWHLYPDLTLLPSQGWDDLGFHPDHQAVGRYALDSSFGSGIGRLYPEVGGEWGPREFYLWTFSSGTHYVDISDSLQMKIQSYLAHKTQYPNTTVVSDEITLLAGMTAKNLGVPGSAEGYTKFS